VRVVTLLELFTQMNSQALLVLPSSLQILPECSPSVEDSRGRTSFLMQTTDDADGLSSQFPSQIPIFAPQGIIPMPITLPYLDDLTIFQEAYLQIGSSQHSRSFHSKMVLDNVYQCLSDCLLQF
jgi:hypothetical protein